MKNVRIDRSFHENAARTSFLDLEGGKKRADDLAQRILSHREKFGLINDNADVAYKLYLDT